MTRRWRNIIRTCPNGDRLICPTVRGALPALVRPGHIVQAFDLDTAIVLAVSPRRCTIETRDGTVRRVPWCEVSVVNAAPDMETRTCPGFESESPDGLHVGCRLLDESDTENPLIGRCVYLDSKLVHYEYRFGRKRSIFVAPRARCALVRQRPPEFDGVTTAESHLAFRTQLELQGAWKRYVRDNPIDAAEIIVDTEPQKKIQSAWRRKP